MFRADDDSLGVDTVDLRRLMSGDTIEVIEELRKLKNTQYHDRPDRSTEPSSSYR